MQTYVYWRTAHGVTLACSFGGVGGTTGGGSQDTYIAEKIDLLTYTDEAHYAHAYAHMLVDSYACILTNMHIPMGPHAHTLIHSSI